MSLIDFTECATKIMQKKLVIISISARQQHIYYEVMVKTYFKILVSIGFCLQDYYV